MKVLQRHRPKIVAATLARCFTSRMKRWQHRPQTMLAAIGCYESRKSSPGVVYWPDRPITPVQIALAK